jgi:NADPH:quinone reductase-like Zn-dependent oxidoreductase
MGHPHTNGLPMRAIGYTQHGDIDKLQVIDRPEPTARWGQVVVEVHSNALNPLDYRFRRGEMGPDVLLGPRLIGRDFAGTVSAVGAGVTTVGIGDRVMGMTLFGTAAQQISVRASKVVKIPDSMDESTAATIPLVGLTAYQIIHDRLRVKPGQHVLVHGASGGVGTYVVQLAKLAGAKVTAVASYRNIEWLPSIGADDMIDYTQIDCCSGTEKYDAFIDCYGNKSLALTRSVLKEDGIYLTVEPFPGAFIDPVLNLGRRQKAMVVVVQNKTIQLQEVCRLIESGAVQAVVQQVYPATEIHKAFEMLETKHTRGKLSVRILGEL